MHSVLGSITVILVQIIINNKKRSKDLKKIGLANRPCADMKNRMSARHFNNSMHVYYYSYGASLHQGVNGC